MLWIYKFQIKLIFAYFQMHVITFMVYLKIFPEYILIIIMMALIEHIILLQQLKESISIAAISSQSIFSQQNWFTIFFQI